MMREHETTASTLCGVNTETMTIEDVAPLLRKKLGDTDGARFADALRAERAAQSAPAQPSTPREKRARKRT